MASLCVSGMCRRSAATAVVMALLSQTAAAQGSAVAHGVEEIVVLRLLRVSRIAPTNFCSGANTVFPQAATIEDSYDLKAVSTDTAGRVTDANGAHAGTLHACYGPTSDVRIYSFYAQGEVGGVAVTGRGQCRVTKRDSPEAGISPFNCQLDLMPLTPGYIGGQLTTNGLGSRATLGPDTNPSGYTQTSIATFRLWKTR